MKKRVLSLVLALVMCVGLAAPAFAADESTHLYAYSCDISGQEEYASAKLSSFIQAYGHDIDTSNFTLGQGILVNDPNDLEKVLFPVWNTGNIVATLLVITAEKGVYQGSYSEIYAQQLNALKNVPTRSNPLSLVVNDGHFYAVISNQWYDLNGVAGEYITQGLAPGSGLDVVDAVEAVPYTVYPQAKIPTSYKKPFGHRFVQPDMSDSDGNGGGYCYAFALASILYNMGYTAYGPEDIMNYIKAPGASKEELAGYLASKGLTCTYVNFDAYMDFQGVQTALYYGNSSMYISAIRTTGRGSHSFVLFGYSDNSITQTYNIWNPWYRNPQIIDAQTRIIPTETTETYEWNNGYLYNIR